jgi:hypothetical protein
MKVIIMKYLILFCFAAVTCGAVEQEKPSIEIAVVQVDRVTGDFDYERLKMLSMDKDTLEATRKLNADQAKLKRDIIEATDEAKLMDLQKQLEFNAKKLSLLRDRNGSNRDINIRKILSEFIVRTYSTRFALILQDTNGIEGRAIYKNVKVTDITDEAAEAFKKDLSDKLGDK